MNQDKQSEVIDSVAEALLSAFLAGRGSTRSEKAKPTMDVFRSLARNVLSVHSLDKEAVRAAALEEAATICEQAAREFLSPEYATPQPVGSITERFACDECAKAIRNALARLSPLPLVEENQ